MSVLDTLNALARGRRPATGLLHNCRFEGMGIETYGVEAIIERFRMAAFEITTNALIIEAPNHIAVFEEQRAIFADLYDGQIARLWVLGSDVFDTGESLLGVPFDPDLSQSAGDLFFAPSDHADLADDAARHVEAAGSSVVTEADGPRNRAFVIRTFGSADNGAVLFAVLRLRLDGKNVAGFHLSAARWDHDSHYLVRDFGSEATLAASRWTPRISA
jgi:hypothetical protein